MVELRDVTPDNWRACASLRVGDGQQDFVMPVAYSLCVCHYGGVWRPLAAYDGDEVVGFLMWAVDPGDGSCWIGGLTVDAARQRRGHGEAIVRALIERMRAQGLTSFALSYTPANEAARRLYRRVGFIETGETEGDDEVVARLTLAP